jgi:transcription factor SPT20
MMQPGSPDIGMTQNTPNNMMMMQGGNQMGQNFTPEQMAMIQTQRALHGGQGMNNGQNLGGNAASMTPEHIQFAQQMAKLQQMFQQCQRQYQEHHQMGQLEAAAKMKEQALAVQRRMAHMKNAMAQRQMNGNAGSPGMNMQQQTPQMGHSHPGFQQQQGHQQMQQMPQQGNMQDLNGMTVQQQQQQALAQQQFAARQQAAQQQLATLMKQHNGHPPPQVIAGLPPYLKQMLQQQTQKQQQARAQAQAQARMQQGHPQQQQQQQQQQNGGGVGNEQYVQHLQRMQNQLGMQMNQPHQQQTPGGGMGMPMGMNNMQQFGGQQQQQQGQGQNDPLNAHFAAMANTLQRGGQGMQ